MISNQDKDKDRDIKTISNNKFNTISNSGSSRQTLANHKNISNIAKILLNANMSRSKYNANDGGKNNSFIRVGN